MTAPRRVFLLGSTGSIGTSTLDVLEHLERTQSGRFTVAGLAAGTNADALDAQATRWGVTNVALADASRISTVEGPGRTVHAGPDGALDLVRAYAREGDVVVAAMVGSAGIPAVLAAIDAGCDVALANKETLVAAGAIVVPRARERGVHLHPVDSEHSAVAQCLRSGRSIDEVRRVVLTASGGPFRTWDAEAIERATVDDALNHPTWSMGRKITVDSATLMNKALEIIEAHWLFDLEAERIEAIVHPQSIVHSFVEYVDGSVIAQLGPPDMRTPIQYALMGEERRDADVRKMDWTTLRELVFEPVDHARFPAVGQGLEVIRDGGTAGAIFNAANEAAVEAFLDGRIAFGRIGRLVADARRALPAGPISGLDDVRAAARAFVAERIDDVGAAPRPRAEIESGLGR